MTNKRTTREVKFCSEHSTRFTLKGLVLGWEFGKKTIFHYIIDLENIASVLKLDRRNFYNFTLAP